MFRLWVLFFLLVPAVFSQQCQAGYTLDAQNNKYAAFFRKISISRCFKVSADAQNYFGASVMCNRDGGFLATIENGFVNSFVGGLLAADKMYFIGFNSLMQTDTWTWVDGTAAGFSNWAMVQPKGGQCAAIQGGTNLWGNPDFSTKLPYICMTKAVAQPVQPGQPGQACLCETGWMYFSKTNACYRSFTDSRKTHAKAESYCVASAGSHLVSIHSSEELYFVSELSATGLAETWPNQVLIGLLKVNGAWTWTDGTFVDYQTWGPGAPWDGHNYGYLFADEFTTGNGYRYKFNNYPDATTTFRAFVCKKPSMP